jgi:hypothetical protein
MFELENVAIPYDANSEKISCRVFRVANCFTVMCQRTPDLVPEAKGTRQGVPSKDCRAPLKETRLGLVAIVVSLLAAAFTGLQWYEARQTRLEIHADTERSLQLSQRAYISLKATTLPGPIFSRRKMKLELLVIGPTR